MPRGRPNREYRGDLRRMGAGVFNARFTSNGVVLCWVLAFPVYHRQNPEKVSGFCSGSGRCVSGECSLPVSVVRWRMAPSLIPSGSDFNRRWDLGRGWPLSWLHNSHRFVQTDSHSEGHQPPENNRRTPNFYTQKLLSIYTKERFKHNIRAHSRRRHLQIRRNNNQPTSPNARHACPSFPFPNNIGKPSARTE
jgi:hypothetical protein